ncbi:MAG: type II toxin-antitoxin system Phd/YefM family antitoxin [Planctomycetota bacterium]
MESINIHDAKTRFSKLLKLVEAGEEVVIAKAGKPVAKLVAYSEDHAPRAGGHWKGLVRIGDDFDAPLPDDVADAFGQAG